MTFHDVTNGTDGLVVNKKEEQAETQPRNALAALSFQNSYYTASESSSITSDVGNVTAVESTIPVKRCSLPSNRSNNCFFEVPSYLFGGSLSVSGDEDYKSCDEGAESLSSPRYPEKGVPVDPLIAAFLGTSFLPFPDTFRNARASFAPINDNFVIPSARHYSAEQGMKIRNFIPENQIKITPNQNASFITPVEVSCIDEIEKFEKKKKRKSAAKKAMNKLKKGLKRKKKNKNSDSSAPSVASKLSSNQTCDSFLSLPGLVLTNSSEGSLDDIITAEQGMKKLTNLQQNIANIKSQSKDLEHKSRLCNSRIQTLVQSIEGLESTLQTLAHQLQTENQTLKSNLSAIVRLEKNQQQLELEENNLKQSISILKSPYQPESANWNGRSRERTSTVDSFITAKSPTSSTTSSPVGDLSEISTPVNNAVIVSSVVDDIPRSPVSESDITIKSGQKKQEQSPSSLVRSTSFVRIDDLDLGTDEDPSSHDDSKMTDSENIDSSRSKLFSLERGDRQLVFDALCQRGYKYATDEGPRWSPDKGTERLLTKQGIGNNEWKSAPGKSILVWSGKIDDIGGFGTNLPIIKARGNISADAHDVMDLLVDSSRVKEYNKMSLGRTDKFCYPSCDKNTDLVVSKVIHSLSKPPIIRKNIELLSLIHARKLDEVINDGHKGYIVVSRSVWENEVTVPDENGKSQRSTSDAIRSEMLLGVNYIREIEENVAELTTVTHLFTPGIPTFGAKKIALLAASNFIRDIQAIFDNQCNP